MSTTPQQPSTDHAEIRAAVRALCAGFPGEYWRRLDRERGYPSEFVAALTEAGFLAALIPEQYGGSGLPLAAAAAIMEEIHASGGNGAACHAQMYTMGTLLRHGSEAQKQRWLPAIARANCGCRLSASREPTSGTDTLEPAHDGGARGRPLHHQRPEDLDLARRAFRSACCCSRAPRHADRARTRTDGLSVFLVDMRLAQGARHQHQSDPHHDEPRHHRDILRRSARAGGKPDRRGRRGLSLHPLRHECRAHPDRG